MATRYEKFLPRLQVRLIDCPEPIAIEALRAACITFCDESQIVIYEPEPMPLVADAATYPLDTPADTVPAVVVDAWADGRRMRASNIEKLTHCGTDWRDHSSTPREYVQLTPDTITLYPKPDARVEEGLKLIIATRPSLDSQGVDDMVYEYWYDTIVAGALAVLYNHAGRPYANPPAVEPMRAEFQMGIAAARQRRQRNFTRGPMRVQMRRFV